MATALEPILELDEKFLDGLGKLEWIDDVSNYQCTRCKKILVQHYIANCDHKFCNNCTRLVGDGSQRWRCPRCNEFITEIGKQNFYFKDRVFALRLHCPNAKYGCEHICPFKQLKGHLERCKHTREMALPVPLKGEPMPELLFEVHQLRWEVKEMKQKMKEIEKMCRNREVDEEQKGVNESAWELNLEVNRMKRVMEEMQKKQKDGLVEMRSNMFLINNRVDGVKSDLHVETTRLRNELKDIQKEPMRSDSLAVERISLAVEENKSKILKLEGKTDAYNEMIKFNNKENSDLMQQLKNDFGNQLDTKQIKIENEMKLLEETMSEANAETDKKMAEMIKKLDEKVNKIEIDVKLENLRMDIETFIITNKQENCEEVNRNIDMIKKEFKDKNDHMIQNVESIKQEINSMATKHEGKMKQLISPFSIEFNGKMLECKTEITKLEKRTKRNKLLIQFNKSTELINLEQNGFSLERFIESRFSQMNCFTLAENQCALEPQLKWTITGIGDKLKQNKFEIKSEIFEWAEYPIRAQAKLYLNPYGHVRMSLNLLERDKRAAPALKLIPHVYYVLRDRTNANNPKHKCSTKRYYFTSRFDYSLDSDTLICYKSHLTYAPYNAEDSIAIEMYVEPPAMVQTAHSFDGTLVWAIDNCRRRKQMAEEELVEYYESPYFYTSARGYRVQMRMRFNWNEKLRAYIDFLPGEFDDDLPTIFPHETTITLFNRKDPQRSITKTVEKDIKTDKTYSIEMCEDNEVEIFLMNDTLFYKVNIKPSHYLVNYLAQFNCPES